MTFEIPAEDFRGRFGSSNNQPVDTEVIGSELVGYCPNCEFYVKESFCNYCPRCGIRLDWE